MIFEYWICFLSLSLSLYIYIYIYIYFGFFCVWLLRKLGKMKWKTDMLWLWFCVCLMRNWLKAKKIFEYGICSLSLSLFWLFLCLVAEKVRENEVRNLYALILILCLVDEKLTESEEKWLNIESALSHTHILIYSEGSCSAAGITIASKANYTRRISPPFVSFIGSGAIWFVLYHFFGNRLCLLYVYMYFRFNLSLKL